MTTDPIAHNAALPSVNLPTRAIGKQRLVYVLDSPGPDAEEMSRAMAPLSLRARFFPTRDSLLAAAAAQIPDCLILGDSEPMDCYEQILQEINDRRNTKIPAFVIRADDTPENRLLAARLRTDCFYSKPINDLRSFVDEVDQRIAIRSGANPFRVLIVDDDRTQANDHAHPLKRVGMGVEIVSHPTQLLAHIADFAPDLVIAERDTVDFPGIEVAGMLRQHEAHFGLPVIILADYVDASLRLEAIRHGAVDILPKPVGGHLLVQAVSAKIERARMLASMRLTDGLTGLYNEATVRKMLESEVAQSIRDKQTCCVVLFDLDNFKDINVNYGHPMGDKVLKVLADILRRTLRKSDLFGRFGGEEFAALLPNTPSNGATIVVNRIREEFEKVVHTSPDGKPFSATLSAGIAERKDRMTAEHMIDAAERAVMAAKRGGKNQVKIA